jgi:hypothetical protein
VHEFKAAWSLKAGRCHDTLAAPQNVVWVRVVIDRGCGGSRMSWMSCGNIY